MKTPEELAAEIDLDCSGVDEHYYVGTGPCGLCARMREKIAAKIREALDAVMTVRSAGASGGAKRKATIGSVGFAEMGRKGGRAVAAKRGRDYYVAIGRKGGAKRVEQLGPDGLSDLGKKGGAARGAQISEAARARRGQS